MTNPTDAFHQARTSGNITEPSSRPNLRPRPLSVPEEVGHASPAEEGSYDGTGVGVGSLAGRKRQDEVGNAPKNRETKGSKH
ncbi:hypothetical protein BGX26_009324 [Mortierella sp. AD094]|nr:hypothetical protein BGX26_009324 [Mortierella sp. AD094]